MSKKRPVQLHPYHKTRYRVQKLKVCKHCNAYTMLPEEPCASCGKRSLISVTARAETLARRSMQTHLLLVTLITLVAILFSHTFLQMALSAVTGIASLLTLRWFQRRALPYETNVELNKLLQRDEALITKGVFRNWEAALDLWKSEPVTAYEMLREISTVQRSSTIRLQQIALLDSFILRRDMDLELDPLLVRHFEPIVAEYIGEIAKLKRELIKEKTLRYVTTFEIEISQMEHGDAILTAVAAAAVRLKRYVQLYPNFIARYARHMPKDRFLRLYKMIAQQPLPEWGHLRDEVYSIYKERYQWDPDFQ